jgi:hypothetical protein
MGGCFFVALVNCHSISNHVNFQEVVLPTILPKTHENQHQKTQGEMDEYVGSGLPVRGKGGLAVGGEAACGFAVY